jgi:hypothetical protein
MSAEPWYTRSLTEMMLHPWATFRHLQGINRLPDRRVSRHPIHPRDAGDPIRRNTANTPGALDYAMGINALEETRIELYAIFREMDTDPMVSMVLDAFGGDASQLDPEHKRIVWCEATNSQVQQRVHACLDRNRMDAKAFPIMRCLSREADVFYHIQGEPGKGIVAIRAYKPWEVARVEDDIGRLIAFSPADERGLPAKKDTNSAQFYQVLHFRLPPRELTEIYGAMSSFLHGSRVVWRELQLMEDQVVIQRLLRRPDRVLILMDSTGMSYDDAWSTVREWERRLHREVHLNPATGFFQSLGLSLDNAKDLVLPRGQGNQTIIEPIPATNTNDLMRDVDMFLQKFAAGIGFPLGFIGRGDPGTYQPGASLSRQSQMFAKRATRLQHAFLEELTRMCMIDLAWCGLDPTLERNSFTLNMASVAPIVEIERAEVIQLKMDRMERALAFGANAQLDMGVWTPYVLEKYGGLSKDLIARVYSSKVARVQPEIGQTPSPGASQIPEPTLEAPPPEPPVYGESSITMRPLNSKGDRAAFLKDVGQLVEGIVPTYEGAIATQSRLIEIGAMAEEKLKPASSTRRLARAHRPSTSSPLRSSRRSRSRRRRRRVRMR